MVVKVKGGFKIKSHSHEGKVYPKVYPSRKAAERRIAQIQRFKHMKNK